RTCALVNPATAQLKVYDLSGKVVADYSSMLRRMKAGDKVMNMLPATLPNGVYVARLYDGGRYLSQRFVTAQ
ncbi:MAG TPA: T9SS type A sorting domain-containing protein, partial [Chitinivibrionales bacterium]|nr:T9SS type A sorting domain-containing protein [Chitinivibrionales bacterium]